MSITKIHTMAELRDLQALPLDFKVAMTLDRIRAFYEAMEGQVYVAFSGGKDSTVLLHLVRSIYPEVKAVYARTGMDFPAILKFVETFENVDFVHPIKHFARIIKEDGLVFPSKDGAQIIKDARAGKAWALNTLNGCNVKGQPVKFKDRYKGLKKYVGCPVPISDVCCDLLKEIPMREYEKRTGLKPMVAIMAQESSRRTVSWLTTGCNVFTKGKEKSKPLSFWTEQDVLHYIVDNHIEIAEPYGRIVRKDLLGQELATTGESRTGCMFCAVPLAHGDNRLPYIRERYPKMYDTFINKLGLGQMFKELGIDYE